jgi:RNA polymerase sigma factor (TIGR02999 family)
MPGVTIPNGCSGCYYPITRHGAGAENAIMPDWEGEWEFNTFGDSPEVRRELDYLFSLTYEELRRLAATIRRSDPGVTLNTTALVNEAWLKLAHAPQFSSTSPLHFKRIAARAMRQLLVEAARRRNADKRGGGAPAIVLDAAAAQVGPASEAKLLVLEAALVELGRVSPRQAMMVEARFFGGLTTTETASLLNVSEATMMRDWRAARAWLARKLREFE